MNKTKALFLLTGILALFALGFKYSLELHQSNSEEIFLPQSSIQNFRQFKNQFSDQNVLVLMREKESLQKQKVDQFVSQLDDLIEDHKDNVLFLHSQNLPKSFSDYFGLNSSRFDAAAIVSSDPAVLKKMIQVMSENRFWKGQTKLLGLPWINYLLDENALKIKTVLFPVLFAVIFILISLVLRSLPATLFIFFPAVASAITAQCSIRFFFGQSNLIFSVIPIIVFVICLCVSLHIYYAIGEYQDSKKAMRHKMKPILLMILTTFLGFLSLLPSSLMVISNFGLLSAGLILICGLCTLFWPFIFEAIRSINSKQSNDLIGFRRVENYFSTHLGPLEILLSSILIFIIGVLSYQKIPRITDATEYFSKSSGLKKEMIEVSSQVVGLPVLEIIIKDQITQKTNSLKNDRMKFYEKTESDLQSQLKELPFKTDILSRVRLIQLANQTYSANPVVPEFKIQLSPLESKLPQAFSASYPAFNEIGYRLTVLSMPLNNLQFKLLVEKIESFFKDQDLRFEFQGVNFHLMQAQREMMKTLFISFSLGAVTIALCAFLVYRSIDVLLGFLLVNFLPVLGTFGLMKIFGLSFNIATVMTFSISLGLIVDGSFHIIHYLKTYQFNQQEYRQVVIRPIVISAFILALCFSLFGFYNFLPIREFGLCLAFVIIFGTISDLKILPSLIRNK